MVCEPSSFVDGAVVFNRLTDVRCERGAMICTLETHLDVARVHVAVDGDVLVLGSSRWVEVLDGMMLTGRPAVTRIDGTFRSEVFNWTVNTSLRVDGQRGYKTARGFPKTGPRLLLRGTEQK